MSFSHDFLAAAGFTLFVIAMLALDLGVFHRKAHTVTIREAALWTGVWVSLAMLFAGYVFYDRGTSKGIEFITGYIVEQSLSVDNVFLFAVIFSFFRVPPEYRHRVLFWGIIGALVMRAVMILAGAALINRYHWIIYIFGGFLVYTGIKMFLHRGEAIELEDNKIVKWVSRLFPVTKEYHGQQFFVHLNGRRFATPLFLTLVMIEVTDLIFAVDSIPAVFGVSKDAFIVYTSNVFAILGLRSLYFLLAGVMELFKYLQTGLSFILMFVGGKMLAEIWHYKMPPFVSLAVILVILAISIGASIYDRRKEAVEPAEPVQPVQAE